MTDGIITKAIIVRPLMNISSWHSGWDFTDGMWLNAPSGVIRKDGSVKPSYELLDHLINHEWHTDETVVTDGEGNVTVTGFKGGYELVPEDSSITLSADSKEFVL